MSKPGTVNYQSFGGQEEAAGLHMDGDVEDDDEAPHESGVIIHVVPESARSRWSPIEDLDSFFTRMYHYHQKHGFSCMMLQEVLELGQFVFVVVFSVFLFHCVNYPILFRDEVSKSKNSTKVSLSDALLPVNECIASMGLVTWVSIIVAFIFWILRLIRVLYDFVQFWEIKSFFNTALNISDYDLDNLTWHEVQKRIRQVQKEHEMCIHKKDLTELDMYHRILRFKNYMVAMVNKSLLPVHLQVPFLGVVVFFTRGLKYNIELLLFRGPWSPFNNWHLKDDYKKVNKRKELADRLSKHISWVAFANCLLSPIILLWQILYSFFNYAEIIKREPGSLGSRCWSLHSRLYLRHFNELDHELNARLNRAYRPASKYMNIFTSPTMTVIAKNVAFVSGALLAVLLILTVYDEDVITVEHVLTALTVLGAILAACRVFIPDENLVWCPEQLMTAVLAHVHYLPDTWRGQAHTNTVRSQFSDLFQYKAVYLLQELISPVVTPYILFFHLRPRALDIIDFYRQFTVEVVGVGDVCSFAQMDIRRHGNPAWQPDRPQPAPDNNQYTQAEDGKTELSLIHFTLTNPGWQPPAEAEQFVDRLRAQATRDAQLLEFNTAGFNNPLCSSLHSMSSLGAGYNALANSILRYHMRPYNDETQSTNPFIGTQSNMPMGFSDSYQNYVTGGGASVVASQMSTASRVVRGGLSRLEGPINSDRGVLLGSSSSEAPGMIPAARGPVLPGSRTMGDTCASLGASVFGSGPDVLPTDPLDLTTADMGLSTLYLHEIHRRQVRRRGTSAGDSMSSVWQRTHSDMPDIQEHVEDRADAVQRLNEKLPLLKK